MHNANASHGHESHGAPKMITDVVPSPTSSSCVLLSSMMLCTAQSAVGNKEGPDCECG